MSCHSSAQRLRVRALSTLTLFGVVQIACTVHSDPGELPEDAPGTGGHSSSGPVDLTHNPIPTAKKLGSGTIKSYVEDTEPEPPFLSGSLFANGFTLRNESGMGGAGPVVITDPVLQLGLGTGNLTTLLLFDRSISMSDLWEGQPRWQVAGRAFISGMSGVEEAVTVGTIFFPQASECEVVPLSDPRQIQFQVGSRFIQHWEAFPQDRFPSGGTPLGPAFERANDVINELAAYGMLPPQRRFRVAVVTDGKPNCGTDEDRVVHLAAEWASRGIELAVIGLPGSEEAAGFLNRLSQSGGTPGYSAPKDAAEAEESFSVVVR